MLWLTVQVGDELAGSGFLAEAEHDDFEAVDGVHLEVDLFGLHFLLQEFECVDFFGHWSRIEVSIQTQMSHVGGAYLNLPILN